MNTIEVAVLRSGEIVSRQRARLNGSDHGCRTTQCSAMEFAWTGHQQARKRDEDHDNRDRGRLDALYVLAYIWLSDFAHASARRRDDLDGVKKARDECHSV